VLAVTRRQECLYIGTMLRIFRTMLLVVWGQLGLVSHRHRHIWLGSESTVLDRTRCGHDPAFRVRTCTKSSSTSVLRKCAYSPCRAFRP
jgi:hypothetical protein